MGTLTVGRVGVEATLDDPRRWQSRATERRDRQTISGFINEATQADAYYLRKELQQHVGEVVPITYSADSSMDGYYRLTGVNIDLDVRSRPLASAVFPFSVTAERIGNETSVEFQSLLTSILVSNDHGITTGEEVFWHAAPQNEQAYTDAGDVTAVQRETEDGTIDVFLNISGDPRWSVPPGDYYGGGAYVQTNSYTRAGLDGTNTLTDWRIGNGLIEVFADANDGVINTRMWDPSGAWGTAVGFQIKYATTTAIPAWDYVTIVRNSPEVCTLLIVRDANEAPPTDHTHNLHITVRRGAPFAYCYFTWTGGATTWAVDREVTDAATAITPTGATQPMALEDAANDGDGNRWILGSSKTTTKDTTNGGIDFASTKTFDFLLGWEIDGSTAVANDDTGAVCLQYLGWSGEQATARRR